MAHIEGTAIDFPFLYYQRIFIKGYVALDLPAVFQIKSDFSNGYIYLRRHIRGLRIRDLDNGFVRLSASGQPNTVRANPVRNIDFANCTSADLNVIGRQERMTWLYTKDDLPRIINDETHSEFIAGVPVKNIADHPVGNFGLIASYLERFVDWYRLVTGDVSISGPEQWNSNIPIYSECLLHIGHHCERLIEDIFVSEEPRGFEPRMFHFDLAQNEIGLQKKAAPGQSHEESIGHYLASGLQVAPAFRRIAEILNLAQTTKDWTLISLAMMPVFEQYLEEFMRTVSAQNSTFKNFVAKQNAKKKMIFISEKIEWMSVALKSLGWDPASADGFISELKAANKERVQVVHYNKQSTFQESTRVCAAIMNNVIMLETALGREVAYAAPLKRLP